MNSTTLLGITLLALGALYASSDSRKETYDDTEQIANSIVDRMIKKHLANREPVLGVVLVAGKNKDASPDFWEKWWKGRSKASMLYAAPKFELPNNAFVIGPKWITVKGHGKTKEDAMNDAKMNAQRVLDEIMRQFRQRGY